jgi:ABC-type Fe3+-hydroxamate transport system substrate-binding protein
MLRDDLGEILKLSHRPLRIVSLVPSLTEAIAVTAPELLVGATDYCTHPAGLDVARVGGSKYPDVAAVLALKPDLVIANNEENRAEDVQALRQRGVPVWVTAPRTLAQAFTSLRRMFEVCQLDCPQWWDEARKVWAPTFDVGELGDGGVGGGSGIRAVVPIWKKPWMAIGRDTFAGDLLRHLGLTNVLSGSPDRYPKIAPSEMLSYDVELVVLPDEPYLFTAQDGPEAFPGIRCALVTGRHLTWYGPSLVEARDLLERQLAETLPAW